MRGGIDRGQIHNAAEQLSLVIARRGAGCVKKQERMQ